MSSIDITFLFSNVRFSSIRTLGKQRLSSDAEEDNDLLRRNDLSDFLDEIPKTAYIILEVCDDDDCDTRSRRVTFN